MRVTAVNDAPTITTPTAVAVTRGVGGPVSLGTMSVYDPEAAAPWGPQVSWQLEINI